jgi:cellulose synthase operon protein C
MNVRRLLGTALWRTGDSQGAVDALLPIAERSDADSYSLTLVGRAFEKLGNRKRAAIYLDRAARPVQVDPVPFGTLDDLGVIERNNADTPGNAKTAIPLISRLLLAGRSAEALAKAQDMQRQNPGVPAAHVLVGDALMALRRPADAANAYKRAANIDFSESTVLRLVEAEQRSGDSPGVVRTLDLFLSQNPRNVPVSLLIAEHYLSVKQWDKAIETLESLRSRVGDRDAAILNNLAWAWLNKGDEKRALVYARAAYQLSQANPAVASTYGWMLYKSGSNIAAGIALLEKAVSSTPGNATLHYQLAQAYAATGKRELAKKQILLALADRSFHDGIAGRALLSKL